MKKTIMGLVTAAMIASPFSSFALEAMNDAGMDQVTGQAGVEIIFEDVTIRQSSGNTAWEDSDGLADGSTTAGVIALMQSGYTVTTLNDTSLTIDVATAETDMTFGTATIATGETFVRIGLPSLDQEADAKQTTIMLDEGTTDQTYAVGSMAYEEDKALGTLYKDAGTTSVDPGGYIYILAH